MPAQAGYVVEGRYRLEVPIGQGGMQQVWKATDLSLDREVAVKVPLVASAQKRFAGSAQLSARVRHANVASALDYTHEADGSEYYVEELIDGLNLQECMDRHFPRFDADTTAKVLHHLAKGVAASHAVSVIHRDMKPSNVIVSGDLSFQQVKITDFGIAKLAESTIDTEARKAVVDSSLAGASSTLLGAIPFLAPEVLRKNTAGAPPVGLPSDVWSLGAMGFWMLTGIHPFGAELNAVVNILTDQRAPWPKQVTKPATIALTDALKAVIESCLQANQSLRPTATQLAMALEKLCYLSGHRVVATVVRKGPYGGVYFSTTTQGDLMLHNQEVVVGPSLSVGQRVSAFSFPGNPDPRGVGIIVLR